MNVTFGKNLQINCSNETFYQFLGYLANHPDDINIVYEKNLNKELGEMNLEYILQAILFATIFFL